VAKINSVDDLYNYIGYVVLRAPNRFPVEDYLPPDQQVTLEKAFDRLRHGIEIAYPDDFHLEKRVLLYSILDQSFAAYKAGEDVKGAHLLQDFERNIFKAEK
jgi:hypothetical protein